MNTPTYEQQWQKITEAYIKNKIQPFNAHFCFCGTLCNGSSEWFNILGQHSGFGQYSGKNMYDMEYALLDTIRGMIAPSAYSHYMEAERDYIESHPLYEDAIFEGMTAALEVLRQIHEEKGDPTAKTITLKKRQLV